MRSVFAGLVSLFVPGFGAGVTGRIDVMIAWAAICALLLLGTLLSLWFLVVVIVALFASMIDGFRRARIAGRAGARWNLLGALAAIGLNLFLTLGLRSFALESFKLPSTSMNPTLEIGDRLLVDKLSILWRPAARGEVIVFRQPCEPEYLYIKRVIALAGDSVEIRCNVVYVNGRPLPSQLVRGDSCAYDDLIEDEGRWWSRPCSEYTETLDDRTYHIYHDPDRPLRDASREAGGRADWKDFPRLDNPREPPSCAAQSYFASPGPESSGQQPGSIVETRPSAPPCEPQLHYVVPPGHVFLLGDNRPNSNDSRYWGSVPVRNIKGRVLSIFWSHGRSGSSLGRVGRVD